MNRLIMLPCIVVLLQLVSAASASSHVIPWRDGESRMKGFGHCAKGPCMKRYDFSESKPHHHHGSCVVLGSEKHSAYEPACRTSTGGVILVHE